MDYSVIKVNKLLGLRVWITGCCHNMLHGMDSGFQGNLTSYMGMDYSVIKVNKLLGLRVWVTRFCCNMLHGVDSGFQGKGLWSWVYGL